MSFAVQCAECERVTELTGISTGDRVYCPYCGAPTTATGSGDLDDVIGDILSEMMADYTPPRRWGGGWVGRICAGTLLGSTVMLLLAAELFEPRRRPTARVGTLNATPSDHVPIDPGLPQFNPFAAPDNLDDALRLLRDGDAHRREAAVDWLSRAPVEEPRREEVAQALLPLLESREWQLHHAASIALAVWGTRATADKLYGLAQREATPGWAAALETLALMGDPRAASLAASYLPNVFKRFAAVRAIELLGPSAEAELVPYLKAPDIGLRREVVRLLGVVGSAKCLPALSAAGERDPQLKADVTTASQAIQKRERE